MLQGQSTCFCVYMTQTRCRRIVARAQRICSGSGKLEHEKLKFRGLFDPKSRSLPPLGCAGSRRQCLLTSLQRLLTSLHACSTSANRLRPLACRSKSAKTVMTAFCCQLSTCRRICCRSAEFTAAARGQPVVRSRSTRDLDRSLCLTCTVQCRLQCWLQCRLQYRALDTCGLWRSSLLL